MPYFVRRTGDPLGSRASLAELPSRGQAVGEGLLARVLQHEEPTAAAPSPELEGCQVELADRVLAAEKAASGQPRGPGYGKPGPAGAFDGARASPAPASARNLAPDAGLVRGPVPWHPTVPAAATPSATADARRNPSPLRSAPILSAPAPTRAGESAVFEVPVENEDTGDIEIAFHATDLINADGRSIPAVCLAYEPPRLRLAPGQCASVTVTIEIPAATPCGTYSGLIRAADFDDLHAILMVETAAA